MRIEVDVSQLTEGVIVPGSVDAGVVHGGKHGEEDV
jgi:hypothetical protein